MKKIGRFLRGCALFLVVVVALLGVVGFVAARRSIIPDNLNMSSSDMLGMNMDEPARAGTPPAGTTLITGLVAPPTDAPLKSFTLTAQTARIDLGDGKPVEAYTYNGSIPGPELRVQQGDLVEVKLVNNLPVSTTIHWHGISVPNAEDGVAGLTQDAVKPGQTFTYRFIAKDVGTYWYHSHQDTSVQLPLGLYGAIIVEPKEPAIQYDHDYTVFLHEWGAPSQTSLEGLKTCHATCPETLSVNNRVDRVSFAANPGETVRLRIANSGNDVHQPVLVGAPFKVIALDGHDLNGPSNLTGEILSIAAAQRYDISFVMPGDGQVALIDSDGRAAPEKQHPMAVFGDSSGSLVYPDAASLKSFDLGTYGTPLAASADQITLNSHFDVLYDMTVGEKPGFFDGMFTLAFTINNQTYPNIPAIKVKLGDLVKIHLVGAGVFPFPHAIHLHGHVFTVLAHNGVALSGSPVQLDTVLIQPGESYDLAFRADNPGLWMLHCHMVEHDAHGMDMMVEYTDIYTPFTIGKTSGNNPF